MITKTINTISYLKNLFIEIFLNKTDKVSDVSDNSVLNATAFGIAKVGQKAIKDVAIVEAQLFPDTATGVYLDRCAELFGVSPRQTAGTTSSTYVRVYGQNNTVYPAGTKFTNIDGISFVSLNDFTIESVAQTLDTGAVIFPPDYGYIECVSQFIGASNNIAPNTISSVYPIPTGHIACTNEYYAIGGQSTESDEEFRQRIKNNLNVFSKNTIQYLTLLFQSVNNNILKIMNVGLGENGMYVIRVVTQNGQQLTQTELDALTEQTKSYFSISDLNIWGDNVGVVIKNVEWYYVGGDTGIDFRVDIDSNYSTSDIRKNIQIALTKYFDFRFWEKGQKIIWDDLLEIVKSVQGVKSVPSAYFYPQKNELVPTYKLPRIKSFVMRNLVGEILYNQILSTSNAEAKLPAIFYSNN